ncbi:MAG: acetyl-CoA synthase subunit gamma [Deltaproteobacteria bacterium]|nr:acetyl-CoA synthase subunit gamma [Deltaproteobacteria bacterium]
MPVVRVKKVPCCGPESSCCPPPKAPHKLTRVSHEWTLSDSLGEIRCRLGSFRLGYRVSPGLYAIGEPGADSDLLVSANYKLSFDKLRKELKGLSAWILVLDTKGINVWCAAGKGTFGTEELIKRIREEDLSGLVSHRRVIVPQLGAPGIKAHEVRKETGFRVSYGPVEAKDIPAYIRAGYKATPEMRTVAFGAFDRVVLTPMELIPAAKWYLVFAILMLAFFGVSTKGITFAGAGEAYPLLVLGIVSVLSGGLATPVLLPYIPGSAFAIKGWIAGLATTVAFLLIGGTGLSVPLAIASLIFFPLASSYIALQFTGSTTFTSISGVKKELKYALPVYIIGALSSVALLVVHKAAEAV